MILYWGFYTLENGYSYVDINNETLHIYIAAYLKPFSFATDKNIGWDKE